MFHFNKRFLAKCLSFLIFINVLISCGTKDIHCDNANMLLSSPNDNFYVDLDSLVSIKDYVDNNKKEFRRRYDKKDFVVYPFTIIENRNVSISRKIGASITDNRSYFFINVNGDSADISWTGGADRFVQEHYRKNIRIIELKSNIKSFYNTNFDLQFLTDTSKIMNFPNKMETPLQVSYSSRDNSIDNLKLVISLVLDSYLDFANKKSKDIWNTNLCDLNTIELDSLEAIFPFKFYLYLNN